MNLSPEDRVALVLGRQLMRIAQLEFAIEQIQEQKQAAAGDRISAADFEKALNNGGREHDADARAAS